MINLQKELRQIPPCQIWEYHARKYLSQGWFYLNWCDRHPDGSCLHSAAGMYQGKSKYGKWRFHWEKKPLDGARWEGPRRPQGSFLQKDPKGGSLLKAVKRNAVWDKQLVPNFKGRSWCPWLAEQHGTHPAVNTLCRSKALYPGLSAEPVLSILSVLLRYTGF